MHGQQLDLFSHRAPSTEPIVRPSAARPVAAGELTDAALIAAIPASTLADSVVLAAEAGQRRLAATVPALEALCRRFAGYGADCVVPEQAAALRALAVIGDRDAGQAVARLIVRQVVQGPVLSLALGVAARLRSTLPFDVLQPLLRHADPAIRANACRCVCSLPEVIPLLVERLDDLDRTVATAAACALGQMGRLEARPILAGLLRQEPSEEVIESVSSIADDECVVLLGRIARKTPGLTAAALAALDGIDHPRAGAIAASIQDRPRA
jgi:HEAT repeat protein